MEPTTQGMNRTGAAVSPEGTKAMTDAVEEFSPPVAINTAAVEAQRIVYISEADALGSIPPPPTVKGMVKAGFAKLTGSNPSIFMDKIGERIAFERAGTRLYDALITKYQAVYQEDSDALPRAEDVVVLASMTGSSAAAQADSSASASVLAQVRGEPPLATLERIRAEELAHFRMLCEAMESLGGDPTAQTPCADATATASMGLIQVLTDPRTTIAQCLNAMLTAELTDNAGWELLIQLSEDAGESELTGRFLAALNQEQGHLLTIKGWLMALVSDRVGTPAV